MFKSIAFLILLILLTTVLNAEDAEVDSLKKLYVPSNVHLQYAGNIGMISIGPSWQFFKNRLDLGFSFGYVPKFSAKKPIYLAAIKAAYTPRLYFKVKKFVINPISVGLVSSYTFGSRFNKYLNQNQYPKGYYWWNTAFRFGLFYQSEVRLKINSKRINGLGLYFEVSSWDIDFYNYTGNSNHNQLSVWDLAIFGFGVKIFFK